MVYNVVFVCYLNIKVAQTYMCEERSIVRTLSCIYGFRFVS